jgi:hypothetical protein
MIYIIEIYRYFFILLLSHKIDVIQVQSNALLNEHLSYNCHN